MISDSLTLLDFSTLKHFIYHKCFMIDFIVSLIGPYVGVSLSEVTAAPGVLGISSPVCG